MNGSKSLEGVFRRVFPVLAVLAYLLAFAIVFNTFDLALDAALYNVLLSLPVFGLFLMLLRRPHWAAIVSGVIAYVLYYADQYVFSARLTHIRVSDLALLSQALRVAGRYPLTWSMENTRRLVILIALSAFLFLICRYYKLKYSKKSMFFIGLGVFAASAVVIISGIIPGGHQEDFDFTSDTEQRGLLYSWYCQAKAGSLEAPEGYSKEAAETILAEYGALEGDGDIRVLVIMNESLADYSLIGTPRFRDPLAFIHHLTDSGEAFEGKLEVSVFGGGTANTEFEFLTGNSTAFLPESSTPYLQYVDHPMSSIVDEIEAQRKIAVHPYYSEEWNRTQVYQFLGFDEFISGVDFGSAVEVNGKAATSRPSVNIVSFGEGPLYVRGLISDQSCYERILEEDAEFTFAVTMQNHGAYVYDGADFTNLDFVTEADREEWSGKRSLNGMLYNVTADNVEEELFRVNQYLTVSELSDRAFGELVEKLRQDPRKTIVLLFGDHQPGVLISEHYVDVEEGVDPDYTVPYVLWANFDMEFDAPEHTSPNYLSAILKKNAGLPLTSWDQFRLDMMEQYPVVTANGILDAEGNRVPLDRLRDYEIVQYMRMFD